MTHREYKELRKAAGQYAKRQDLQFKRETYGFLDKTHKVPVRIYDRGCQIQLAPKGIKITDVWRLRY